MSTDDRMETITDPPPEVGTTWVDNQHDVWTMGRDGMMFTPETGVFSWAHVQKKWGPLRSTVELVTDPAAIRDSADERELCRCGCGGYSVVTEAIDRLPATGLVVVNLQAELADVRHTLRLRSDALARVTREADALRAKVAAVEALRPKLLAELRFIWTAIDGRQYREAHEVIDYVEQWFLAEDRAALAVTTGEGQ